MLSNFFSKNLYFFFIIFVTFLILLFLTDFFLIRDIVIHNLFRLEKISVIITENGNEEKSFTA